MSQAAAERRGAGARPLLLLDVDGVLNPFPDCPAGFDEHWFFPGDDEPVRLAAAHASWLRELTAVYDAAWATGWGAEANRVLCPHFGLPELPVLVFEAVPFEPRVKVPAIDAFAGDRPAAWVDDSLVPEAWAWAAARRAPTLLVEVESAHGLTRRHVDELLAWAAAPVRSGLYRRGVEAKIRGPRPSDGSREAPCSASASPSCPTPRTDASSS